MQIYFSSKKIKIDFQCNGKFTKLLPKSRPSLGGGDASMVNDGLSKEATSSFAERRIQYVVSRIVKLTRHLICDIYSRIAF